MKFKFKKNVKTVPSGDLYYDFFDGGYIEPDTFLNDKKQIEEINKARILIREYFEALEEKGLIEIY